MKHTTKTNDELEVDFILKLEHLKIRLNNYDKNQENFIDYSTSYFYHFLIFYPKNEPFNKGTLLTIYGGPKTGQNNILIEQSITETQNRYNSLEFNVSEIESKAYEAIYQGAINSRKRVSDCSYPYYIQSHEDNSFKLMNKSVLTIKEEYNLNGKDGIIVLGRGYHLCNKDSCIYSPLYKHGINEPLMHLIARLKDKMVAIKNQVFLDNQYLGQIYNYSFSFFLATDKNGELKPTMERDIIVYSQGGYDQKYLLQPMTVIDYCKKLETQLPTTHNFNRIAKEEVREVGQQLRENVRKAKPSEVFKWGFKLSYLNKNSYGTERVNDGIKNIASMYIPYSGPEPFKNGYLVICKIISYYD
ncbi:hypothetical protein CPAV1605_935 [seawater metagenome]|uniref:Uncharacterized protein n=1 Tax=seawater metagenome TaxID=1561972 RepID=A0A5E8CMF1_9ZZZZ